MINKELDRGRVWEIYNCKSAILVMKAMQERGWGGVDYPYQLRPLLHTNNLMYGPAKLNNRLFINHIIYYIDQASR